MAGVQSFVAQRQQARLDPIRQVVGARHRVPVPTTKLESIQQEPSTQRPNPDQAAGPPAAVSTFHLSRPKSAKAPAVPGGFDTDAEGVDDTVTMSIGSTSQGHQGEGDDRNQTSSQYGVDTANVVKPGAQVPFQRGKEQPHHVLGPGRLDVEGSGEEDNEESYGESTDEEGDEESDEEELVHDEILQDLNSPGFSQFSQYLQGETTHTTEAVFQPVMATPVVRGSLASKDVVQHPQKPEKYSTFRGNSVNGGASDPNVNLQYANCGAFERVMKQTSAVPVQELKGTSIEQSSILAQLAAQQRNVSDHHEPSPQPSITSHQTLRPKSRARSGTAEDIVATSVQRQAGGGRLLPVQIGSIDVGNEASVDWNPNANRTHDSESTVSADCPHARKRARDLDYSADQITSMTFQQLSSERFNLASDIDRASLPQELSSGTLAAKMDYILEKLKDEDTKTLQRRAFFSSLSIEQYEECANFMICRFTDIMSKVVSARQQRRRASKDFEEKIAKREECVRGKTTVVDQDLGRLKRGGEEVVRGAAL